MVSIVCALVLMSAHFQIEAISKSEVVSGSSLPATLERSDASNSSPHKLYTLAAEAIARGDVTSAIGPLQALVQDHRDSPRANIAVFHLAECYLLVEQPADAVELLATWSAGPSDERSDGHIIPPRARSKMDVLFQQALRGLPKNAESLQRLEVLYEQVETPSDEPRTDRTHPLMEMALEISRRHEACSDFAQAHAWLERVREMANEEAVAVLRDEWQFRLPMAWAQHAFAAGETANCINILERAMQAELTQKQQLSMGFLRAEALLAAGEWEEARHAFDELAQANSDEADDPAWHAIIDLRRSELLILSRKYRAAQRLLESAKQSHADYPAVYEFDYLLARCAIANIDFDAARQYLQLVIHSPRAAGREATARAGWLLGETYFLQQQFDQALASYQHVIGLAAFPVWQARARLQSAKCYELLGQTDDALQGYLSVNRNGLAEAYVAQEASDRIAAIRSAVPVPQ